MYQNNLDRFLKQISGFTPRAADSVVLGWCLRISMPNKFSGDADAVGPRTALEDHLFIENRLEGQVSMRM